MTEKAQEGGTTSGARVRPACQRLPPQWIQEIRCAPTAGSRVQCPSAQPWGQRGGQTEECSLGNRSPDESLVLIGVDLSTAAHTVTEVQSRVGVVLTISVLSLSLVSVSAPATRCPDTALSLWLLGSCLHRTYLLGWVNIDFLFLRARGVVVSHVLVLCPSYPIVAWLAEDRGMAFPPGRAARPRLPLSWHPPPAPMACGPGKGNHSHVPCSGSKGSPEGERLGQS